MSSGGGGVSALVRMTAEEPPLPVRLHPLVILNVTQHVTRMQQRQRAGAAVVLGVLLGRTAQDGATEITTSYEAVGCEPVAAATTTTSSSGSNSDSWCVDWVAVQRKKERLAEVFPELSVVGWYGVGGTREDVVQCSSVTHVALCEAFDDTSNGMMFALMVDWAPPVELATLPVHLFEATILHTHHEEQQRQLHIDEQRQWQDAQRPQNRDCDRRTSDPARTARGSSRIIAAAAGIPGLVVELTKIRFLLESDEIAQVAVDAAMNCVSADSHNKNPGAATVTPHLKRIVQSLRLLQQRIVLVTEYLRAVECGRVTQPDPDVLRHISNVSAMLPAISADDSAPHGAIAAIEEEERQSLAVALISLETKCTVALSELVRAQKKLH
ncbi:COP9 signalosome complex subunit 6 [Trypanosoma grayi]|uniref:COP9 signalosome complex subunit 6 n=1 Tax=Trypanosoma grayi TaxID=71804 RepID=UPI0004F40762|nr:COP9 signalosome complex subunit 6 [Trypanosoma grayi]KEG06839.1 COP9 signalosome complex subunit 6 [Trypanosoma grayi]